MLDLIDMGCFRGILMYFTMICAEIRLEFGLSGIAGCLICLIGDFLEGGGRFWKGGYIGIACSYGVPMYFTLICAEIRFGWDYVATRVA